MSRLLGAPPGYLGHDRTTGTLVDALRRRPASLLALQDFDRAHPEVQAVLAGLASEGRLQDAAGRTASLAQAIIVYMPSSAAAAAHSNAGAGGAPAAGSTAGAGVVLRGALAELAGVVDAVVPFSPLSDEALGLVLDAQLREAARAVQRSWASHHLHAPPLSPGAWRAIRSFFVGGDAALQRL